MVKGQGMILTFNVKRMFLYLPIKLYLTLAPKSFKILTTFRNRNHKLRVELGRRQSKPVHERICSLCGFEVGDEFYYMMTYIFF